MNNQLLHSIGCYWGTEKYIKRDFQKRFPNSIKSASVGFMSPFEGKPWTNTNIFQLPKLFQLTFFASQKTIRKIHPIDKFVQEKQDMLKY